MFTAKFWKGTLERSVATAAQAAILAIGADQINVLEGGLLTIAGFAAGGFLLAFLKCLAATQLNNPESPSLVDVDPTVVKVPEADTAPEKHSLNGAGVASFMDHPGDGSCTFPGCQYQTDHYHAEGDPKPRNELGHIMYLPGQQDKLP